MRNNIRRAVGKIRDLLAFPNRFQVANDDLKILMGRSLAEVIIRKHDYKSLADLEFKVFSQFGDDGIIQYLTNNLDLNFKTFIEFGVENYFESNTRFLLQKDNWSGYVMDGSKSHIDELMASPFFWRHALSARAAFVTKDNINELLTDVVTEWGGVDLLHIDIDGNDYWVWEAVMIAPVIVVMEYNSVFGIDRAITVPYDPAFYRTSAHFSNLYWGSSLKALCLLAEKKGYDFIGSNSAGNNAYFVRKPSINDRVRRVSLNEGYVISKYREARNERGDLTFTPANKHTEIIRGLPVFDVELGKVVPF